MKPITLPLVAVLFALCACRHDATTELRAWTHNACSCEDRACAESQREVFWTLVQEYRDEVPSRDKAEVLDALIGQAQGCLEGLGVDIYTLN